MASLSSYRAQYPTLSDEELGDIFGGLITEEVEEVIQPEEDKGRLSDFAYGVTGAANSGFAGLARTADTVFGDGVDGEFIQQLDSNAEYANSQLSDRQKATNQKKFFSDEEGKTFGDAWSDPDTYLNAAAQFAGSAIPLAAGGLPTSALRAGLVAKGAIQAGGKIAGAIGAVGLGASETALVSGSVGGEIQKTVNEMPFEVLVKAPAFVTLFQQKRSQGLGLDEAGNEARLQLGREAGVQGMKDVAPLSFMFGTVAGRFLDKAMTGKLVGGRLKAASAGVLTETPTEGLQGASEQVVKNEQLGKINPEIGRWDGVLEAGVGEAVGGFVGGASIGYVTGRSNEDAAEKITDSGTVDEAINNFKDSLDWEAPTAEYKPVAERLIANRQVDGQDLQSFIDSRTENPNAYNPETQAPDNVWTTPEFKDVIDEGRKTDIDKAFDEIRNSPDKEAQIDKSFEDRLTIEQIERNQFEQSHKDGTALTSKELKRQRQKLRKFLIKNRVNADKKQAFVDNLGFEIKRFADINDGQSGIISNDQMKSALEKALNPEAPEITTDVVSSNAMPQSNASPTMDGDISVSVEPTTAKDAVVPTHEDETGEQYISLGNGEYQDGNGEAWSFNDNELTPVSPQSANLPLETVAQTETLNLEETIQNEQTGKTKNEASQEEIRTQPGEQIDDSTQIEANTTSTAPVPTGEQETASVPTQQEEVKYHPAIEAMAKDLIEGGGISVDKDGKRNKSLNPEWFADGAFKIMSADGTRQLETSPSVTEVKAAVDTHLAGKTPTGKQRRILAALSEEAEADQAFQNEQYAEEQKTEAKLINAGIINGSIDPESLHNEDTPEGYDSLFASAVKVDNIDDFFGVDNEIEADGRTEDASASNTEEITPDSPKSYTRAELERQEADSKQRQRQASERELKAQNKETSDKSVDSLADEMLGNTPGTGDIFGNTTGLEKVGPAEGAAKISPEYSDPVAAQKLLNWIAAGELIIRTGKFNDDRKRSKEYIDNVKRSVESTKAKLAKLEVAKSGVKFSKSIDTEVKNLAIVHNLTADNIAHADKMGGLAVPSLAVVNKDFPMSGFGEISLIGSKEHFGPSKDNQWFDADVYSPRYPSVSYELNYTELSKANDTLSEDTKELAGDRNVFGDELEERGLKDLNYSLPLQYEFLQSIGKAPAIKYLPATKLDSRLTKHVKNGSDRQSLAKDSGFIKDAVDTFNDRMKLRLGENIVGNEDRLITDYDSTQAFTIANQAAYKVVAAYREKKVGRRVDVSAVDTLVRKRLKNKEAEYKKWVKDNYANVIKKEKIFDGYTPSGNRKYKSHDLETVVKLMKKKLRGGEDFNYGGPALLRSHLANQLKKVSDMQGKRSNIVSIEEMGKLKGAANDSYNEIESKLNNQITEYSNGASDLLEQVAKTGWRGIASEFGDISTELKTEVDEFLNLLKHYPTEYFEGKVQRSVSLSEFEGAVVPLGKEYNAAIETLKQQGITNIRRYKSGDDASRAKAVNGFKSLLFSKSNKPQAKSTVTQIKALLPRRVQNMVDAGKLKVVQSVDALPEGLREAGGEGQYNYVIFNDADVEITAKYSNDLSGVEGLYDLETDTTYLVADALDKDNLNSTLNHELYHRARATDKKFQAQLSKLDKQLQDRFKLAAKGVGSKADKDAYKRVMDANTGTADQIEEFQAYLITAYAKNPDSFKGAALKWIKDLYAAIRAVLIRNGIHPKNITPADLNALSKYGAKVKSDGSKLSRENPIALASEQGYKGNDEEEAGEWNKAVAAGLDMSVKARMARAKEMGFITSFEDTLAKSSGDKNASTPSNRKIPQRFYHGTAADIEAFEVKHVGRKDKGWIGSGVYVALTPELANTYANVKSPSRSGKIHVDANVMPLYIRADKIYVADEATRAKVRNGSQEYVDNFTAKMQADGYEGAAYFHARGEVEIVIFDPRNVRSIHAAFDPANSDSSDLLASKDTYERFYSQLKREIQRSPDRFFDKSGDQIKAWLKSNAPKLGIKADEIYWSGVNEWLDIQDGKVSKSDMVGFLGENGVQVESVTLDGDLKTRKNKVISNYIKAKKVLSESIDLDSFEDKGLVGELRDMVDEDGDDQYYGSGLILNKGKISLDYDHGEDFGTIKTDDYYGYSLNNATNNGVDYYINRLLSDIDLTIDTIKTFQSVIRGNNKSRDADDLINKLNEFKSSITKLEASPAKHGDLVLPGGKHYKELVLTIPTTDKFNESDETHFGDVGEGKQIAWIRHNTRIDDQGNDTLFLEEVQSQRGQEGRTDGFESEPNIYEDINGFFRAKDADGNSIELRKDGEVFSAMSTREDVKEAIKSSFYNKGVPPAPFVTDKNNKATNAYITLLLKKAISHAIDNGQTSISWTTGDQQADRYDLSKKIKEVHYVENEDTQFSSKTGKHYFVQILDNNGEEIDLDDNDLTIPEITNLLGKEIADKIESNEGSSEKSIYTDGRMLAGNDLRVGGAWTQAMYGDESGMNSQGKPALMTQAAREITKKLGGTISSVVLDTGTQPALIITPEMRSKVLNEGMPLFSKTASKRENSRINMHHKDVLKRIPELTEDDTLFSKFDPSRRKLLIGASTATAAAVTVAVTPQIMAGDIKTGKAKPLGKDLVGANVSKEVEDIIRKGGQGLKAAIKMISETAPVEFRALAKILYPLIPNEAVVELDEIGRWNAHGAAQIIEGESVRVRLFTAGDRTGLSYGTILHESLHAAVMARYISLSRGSTLRNYQIVKADAPKAEKDLAEFVSIWNEFDPIAKAELKALKAAGKKDTQMYLSLEESYSNPDEFFVRALTDPFLQEFMSSIEYRGKTLLERFKSWIKSTLFGLKQVGTIPSWLDAALMASNDLTEAMYKDDGDFSFAKKLYAHNEKRRQKDTPTEFSKTPKFSRSSDAAASFTIPDSQKEKLTDAKATVKKFMQRNFTPKGLMPDKVFDTKLKSDFMKNVGEEEVQFLSYQLRNAALEAFNIKHYADLPVRVTEEINKELNGEKSTLPPKVKEAVVAMRAMMDSLSGELQQSIIDNIELRKETMSDKQVANYDLWLESDGEQGGAPEDIISATMMLQTIESNKGNYVHRSYQAFDDADWMDKALKNTDLITRAEAFIAEQRPKLTESQVSAEVKGILQTAKDKGDMTAVISRGRKQGSKDMSIMKKRKNVDPIIRELLGEHKDPLVNFTKSTTKMQWYVANHYFLTNVRKDGAGVFLLKQRDTINGVDYIQPVASKSNQSLNPLSGLFTSIDFNNALEDAIPSNNSSDLVNQYIKWNSAVKYGKTILSPTTQFRNFMSAGMFSIMSGHFNWSHGKQAAKVMRSDIFTHEGEYHKYIKDLIGKGVLHDNPFAGELRDALNDFYEQQDHTSGTKKGVKAVAKRALEFAQKSYQAGDDFWKIIGYENELQAQLDNGVSQGAAEEKAAYRIRNGYPTYSMVPKGMRWLRRFPLMGTFVSFPYEIVRTTINNIEFIKEDMKTDKASAAKRIVGMSIASSAAYAASKLSMALMGLDDEDDEAIKLIGAPWSRNSQLFYVGYDENGLPKYLDLSSLDPYTYLKKPLSAILSGNNEGMTDKLKDAAKEMLDPFLGVDIAAGKIFEVISNKKESGGSVYNEQDADDVKMGNILNHLRKGLQPGVVSNVERMAKAVMGSKSRSGKEYTVSDESMAFIGFRMSTANMSQSMIYKGYTFLDSKKDAQRILSSAAGTREAISDSDIKGAFNRSMKARDAAYKEMIKISKSMLNFGISRRDVIKSMKGAGMTMRDIASIMRGYTPKWTMSSQFIRSAMNRASASSVNGKERLEIIREINKRKVFIRRLGLAKKAVARYAD